MFEAHDVLFLWTETPLHAGSGATVGVIDLPIQRERQTDHPIIQSSGIKGALRDHCKGAWGEANGGAAPGSENGAASMLHALFGPETENADAYGGAISFSEARLLLFPVRSLRGVFVWITCPLALARLQRDLARTDCAPSAWSSLPAPVEGIALVTADCPALLPAAGGQPAQVVLEEYAFTADSAGSAQVGGIAKWLRDTALPESPAYAFWRERLCTDGAAAKSHLVILNDSDYTEFVKHSTDIVQRIKIDADTGIVASGALWTEENLPAECLLYTVMHAMPPRTGKGTPAALKEGEKPSAERAQQALTNAMQASDLLQLGGNETVGRGLTRIRTLKGGSA